MLVVLNASAGGGDGDLAGRRRAVMEALGNHGVDAEVFDSDSEHHTKRRIDEALGQGYAAIVVAGGDGTVRSVAFDLLDRKMPLGILPMGTAMNVARSLGVPLDLDAAAAVLARGKVRTIDVGEIRGRPFLEVATIGLAADLLAEATKVGEGRLRSALELLRLALRHRRTRVWLQLDEAVVRHRVTTLAVANGPFTGRAMKAAPEASIDDGLLDVVCFLGYGPLDFIKQLARIVLGLTSGPRTRTYRTRRAIVRSHHPLPVRADSQDAGTTPVEIGVRGRALDVLGP
jgi:diacylglycerol kinase (ATP)